jgi:lambda family phage tail tape measure protein
MATLKVALTLASQQFTQGLATADRQLQAFGQSAQRIGQEFDAVFSRAGTAATALGAALTGLTTAAVLQADRIVDLSRAYDVSIGSIYELNKALQASGGESDSAGRFISEFNKSILEAASGNLKTLETFNKLGVSLQDIGRLSETELRDRVLAGLLEIPDSATRSATAMQLFGKAVMGVSIEDLNQNLQDNRGRFDNMASSALAAADAMGNIESILGDLKRAALVAFEPLLRAISRINIDFDAMVTAIRAVAVGFAVLTGAAVIGGMIKLVELATTLGTVLRRNPVVAIAGLALQLGIATGALSALFKESEDGAQAVTKETQRLQQSQKNITRDVTGAQRAREKEAEAAEKQRLAQEAAELQARTTLARQRAALQDIAANFALANQTQIQNLKLQERGLTITADQLELETALQQQRDRNAAAELAIRRNFEGLAEKEQETNRAFFTEQLANIQRNGAESLRAIQGQIQATQVLRDIQQRGIAIEQETASIRQRLQGVLLQDQLRQARTAEERIELENRFNALVKIRESLFANVARLDGNSQKNAIAAISQIIDTTNIAATSFDQLKKRINESLQSQVQLGKISQESFDRLVNGGLLDRIIEGYKSLNSVQQSFSAASREFSYGWNEAFRQYADSAANGAQRAQQVFSTVTRGLEDSIINFVKTGKLSFKDLINSIIETILRSQLQQLFASLFAPGKGGSGGNLFSALFAGFFADGGRIPSGRFGVVGEAGPELVGGPATVTPITAGGGATMVTYNIQATDAASFQQLLARDPEFLFAVTEQGRRRLPNNRR